MTINIFVLKGDLNGKIVMVRFFFVWYILLKIFASDGTTSTHYEHAQHLHAKSFFDKK